MLIFILCPNVIAFADFTLKFIYPIHNIFFFFFFFKKKSYPKKFICGKGKTNGKLKKNEEEKKKREIMGNFFETKKEIYNMRIRKKM